MTVPTIAWNGGVPGTVELIDQTLLPGELKVLRLDSAEGMWEAIRALRIRGAPAIGIAAAFGLVLGVQGEDEGDGEDETRADTGVHRGSPGQGVRNGRGIRGHPGPE